MPECSRPEDVDAEPERLLGRRGQDLDVSQLGEQAFGHVDLRPRSVRSDIGSELVFEFGFIAFRIREVKNRNRPRGRSAYPLAAGLGPSRYAAHARPSSCTSVSQAMVRFDSNVGQYMIWRASVPHAIRNATSIASSGSSCAIASRFVRRIATDVVVELRDARGRARRDDGVDDSPVHEHTEQPLVQLEQLADLLDQPEDGVLGRRGRSTHRGSWSLGRFSETVMYRSWMT